MSHKVLITGADGFTGRYLGSQLNALGLEVHGLLRNSKLTHAHIPGYSSIEVADLSDVERLVAVCRELKPNYVVHLAAISFVAHGDPSEIYQTNLIGSRNLLEALYLSDARVDSVLLASSANVYGNSNQSILTEDSALFPANDYAVSKISMEYLASLYRSKLPIFITRPFNYTGVGQSRNFLIPKIVFHAKQKLPIIELGNIKISRDFSDVRTVVEYYARLLTDPSAVGGVFNICSGISYSIEDILRMVSDICGHELTVKVNKEFFRDSDVLVLAGSNERLKRIASDVEGFSMNETLRWMLDD